MFVDPNRLVEIEDCSQIYVGLGFAGIRSFTTTGEPVLLIDPVHLADVYDTRSDKTAHYLRRHGVFVADFGGDSQAPVLWSDAYLVLPTSMQLPKDFAMPRATRGLVPAISCDSGSFMFLPLSDGVPGDVRRHLVPSSGIRQSLSFPPARTRSTTSSFLHRNPTWRACSGTSLRFDSQRQRTSLNHFSAYGYLV